MPGTMFYTMRSILTSSHLPFPFVSSSQQDMPLTAEQKERYKKAKRDKRAREKLEKEAKLKQQ